jgi:hypothetical protein
MAYLVRDLTARVGAWVDAHLGELSDRSPVSVHLDALGGSWEAGDVETALAAFAALATRVAELGDPGRAGLILPLTTGTTRLRAAVPPTLDALKKQQLRSGTPPTLYVVTWVTPAMLVAHVDEEYKAPLPFAFPSLDGMVPADRVLHAYYREHRWPEAIARGWDFARGVYVDAYPPGYA